MSSPAGLQVPPSKLDAILTDPADVVGEIYVMKNTKTGMEYVGQVVSHRLNHGKYRPHGSRWRFREHVGEAVRSMKNKVGCVYLNNAIREDGADAFALEVILYCPVEELDKWEAHHIAARGSLYPGGYNLRAGGRRTSVVPHDVRSNAPVTEPRPHGGRTEPHTTATKELMSRRLKELHATGALVGKFSSTAKEQHSVARLEAFADVAHLLESADDLGAFVKERRSKADGAVVFVYVELGGKKTRFWPGPRSREAAESDVMADDLRREALDFLTTLKASTTTTRDKKREEELHSTATHEEEQQETVRNTTKLRETP